MMLAVQDNPPALAPKPKEEIAGNAQRLVSVMGEDALTYALLMSDRTQKGGDDNDRTFWKKIADRVELLLDEPVPDRN